MEYRVITKAMQLYPYQRLYFTTVDYADLRPLFQPSRQEPPTLDSLHDTHVLLVTGIASPEQMIHDLTPHTSHLTPLTFADHHQFRHKDVQLINDTFAAMPSPKLLITTEKDATRLKDTEGLSDDVRANLYVLPLHISFMQDQEEAFDRQITDYVRKNSKNSILNRDKEKDDLKPHNSGPEASEKPRTISFR
jgi:tetraacyldisaccharide 4'-kinase